MEVTEVLPKDVVAGCREAVGLPARPDAPAIEDELLASLVRVAAGVLCPCSRATLRTALLESLHGLVDQDWTGRRIDSVIEGVVLGGDLLELSEVSIDDPDSKGTWVFAAPPAFVVRSSGSIFVIGIVPDQASFLPHTLSSRILHEGLTRVLEPEPGEDLARILADYGLRELSEEVWLRCPPDESPRDLIESLTRQLETQPRSGAVLDLRILDPVLPVTHYRSRWTAPRKRDTGIFVARRPQEFGAPIWCIVSLEAGEARKMLDLPSRTSPWRACDVAWHFQMALDHSRNTPQVYRRYPMKDGFRLDFFSPLPGWSERRLMVFGRRMRPEGCIISFWIPVAEAESEESFLRQRLWLAPKEESQ